MDFEALCLLLTGLHVIFWVMRYTDNGIVPIP
jgi:hypothetical protein